ncbi:MAG: hypothetical protein QOG88_1919 [Actinomycetota bacterium]|jgi:hypothetical protein|nr:hypothetical protein [Actinomycetota bacterium]
MSAMKSLWASVQGDPVFMRKVNGWLTIFWLAMIPVSMVTHWIGSVTYVAALSLWALVSGHWSAWQAARVEVKQQEEAETREEEDLPGEIVERLVSDTDVEPDPASPPARPSAVPAPSSP